MKLLGLLLVVCCGAGIGVMQAMRLRQTHRNLEQLCRMLRELSVQMAFRSLTVQELLEQLCREPAYAAFQFPVLVLSGLEQGMPLADAWESGIRQDKAIPETGKNLLLPLGEELGASDLDGQTATLSQYRRQLEPYAAEAGELCRRKQLQPGCSGRLSGGNPALLKGKTMEIDLIFKIAGTGIIVAVLNLVLKRAEREEQAMMTTLAGLVVVLMLLVDQIGTLFERVKSVFGL